MSFLLATSSLFSLADLQQTALEYSFCRDRMRMEFGLQNMTAEQAPAAIAAACKSHAERLARERTAFFKKNKRKIIRAVPFFDFATERSWSELENLRSQNSPLVAGL